MHYKKHTFTKLCTFFICITTLNMHPMLTIPSSIKENIKERMLQQKRKSFCTLINNIASINDLRREIALRLFNRNTQPEAIDKFMAMPIGKALEWYAISQNMSRGKIIYKTPLFTEIFKTHKLRFPYNNNHLHQLFRYQNSFIYGNSPKTYFCTLSDKNQIESIYTEESKKFNGKDLEFFLDIIKAQLFLLSPQEMSTFIKIALNHNDSCILHKDIKHIQSLTKKIMQNPQLFLQWKHNFSFKNLDYSFIYRPLTPLCAIFLPAIILTGLSSFIKHSIATQMIYSSIDEENHLRNVVNTLIHQSNDERLLKYLYPLVGDPETLWSWDSLKINSPFLSTPFLFLLFTPFLWDSNYDASTPVEQLTETLAFGTLYGLWSFLFSRITLVIPMDTGNQFLLYFGFCGLSITTFILLYSCYKLYYSDHWQQKTGSLSEIIKHRRIWDGGWLL